MTEVVTGAVVADSVAHFLSSVTGRNVHHWPGLLLNEAVELIGVICCIQ